MASTPNLTDRNDVTLWAANLLLEDLLSRAADWTSRPEPERLDFFLEWEESMDRLTGAIIDAEAGRLSVVQQERLAALAARLTAARTTIDHLGLDYPDLGRLSLAS